MSTGGSTGTPCILSLEEGVRMWRGHNVPPFSILTLDDGGEDVPPGGAQGPPVSILTLEEGVENVPPGGVEDVPPGGGEDVPPGWGTRTPCQYINPGTMPQSRPPRLARSAHGGPAGESYCVTTIGQIPKPFHYNPGRKYSNIDIQSIRRAAIL